MSAFVAEIDGFVRSVFSGLGLAAPADDSEAGLALRGLVADGALLLALDATYPAGEGPAAATELQERAAARYAASLALLLSGKHPAVLSVEATTGETAVPSATDFWSENPLYGLIPRELNDETWWSNPHLDPTVGRGMAF